MILEIDAQGWVAIIGAISAAGVAILAGVAGVVLAWQNSKKLDAAAARREDIAQAIVNPESPIPPKVP